VAVFILTISMAALLNLVSTSLSAAKYSRDEVTANYLIQEVVDSVRNKRDSSAFLGGNWNDFINYYGGPGKNGCFADEGCSIDVFKEFKNSNSSTSVSACSNDKEKNSKLSCLKLNVDAENEGSYYTTDQKAGVPSIFRRQVKMKSIPDGVNATVTVEWNTENNGIKSRELKFSLMNWY
jgi:Tfp pilus assembly protein PilV